MAAGRFYKGAGRWRGRHLSYDGFNLDRNGIAQIAVGPEIRQIMSSIVSDAMEFAQLIAPSDTHGYQSSFQTDVLEVPDIPFRIRGEPMARWSGRVVNTDKSAIYVEVGGLDSPDRRIMRRTLEWIEAVADN